MEIPRTRFSRSRRQLALQNAVESLETRAMLAVSLDASGWTQVTSSADTKTVYVSSSSGSDSNDGLSQSEPVKTIGRGVSLLRSSSPDHLLLKRGDVFNEAFPTWSKSGRNAQEPMLISSYGSDADRPWIKTSNKSGFYSHTAFHDVAIIGLKFEANTRNPDSSDYKDTSGGYGLQIVAPINGLLVEDTSFDHYVYNVSVQGFSDYAKNVKFRRSEILDSYMPGAKAVGFYSSMTDGMLLEDNIFDHNGWNEKLAPSGTSHNIYFWESTRNPIVRGNIIANGGQHGLQARGGGTIENNLFIRNPIHLLVGNGSTVTPGGVVGRVSGNIFLDSKDMAGAGRGWAIELGNIKPGGGSYVRDNIIAQDSEDHFAAIKLETATGATNASEDVGINDLTIEDNIIYKWHQGISIASGYDVGGSGQKGLNDIVISDNDFQNILYPKIINHNPAYDGSEEKWSGNSYYSTASSSGWFSIAGKTTSFATWKSTAEPTASNEKLDYPDPSRNVATYNGSLGGTASRDAFLKNVRAQTKADWDKNYTAAAAISYVRAGFTGATPSDIPTPTPTPTPAPEPMPEPPTSSNTAPTAALTASDRTAAGTSSQQFKVTFSDEDGVKVSSFGNGDIRVSGPNGYDVAASFVSADSTTSGTPRTATYSVAAPGGSWDANDNGTYTVNLNAGGVKDVKELYAPAQTLGTFKTNIASTAPTTGGENPTVVWSNFDPDTQAITIRFSEDVSASLRISDMRLKDLGTSQLIPYDQMRMTYDKATNTAVWTFTDRIAAANYKVMLGGVLVSDASGNLLDGNADGAGGDDYVLRISAAELTAAATLAALSSQSDPFAPAV